MSHIYEAHHLRLEGHRFAVKVLLAELATDEALVARFGREIKAVASIDHPRVVRVYDFGVTSQGWPYMVSEFLVGMDLAAWLQNFGALPLDTVFHVGRGLAEALSTTHAHGVIHRDLKPSNVFLVGDFAHGPPKAPEVKILDFGLSRFLDRDDGLTKTRLVLGTPAYMSPEQARGERGDRLSDIYGLGAVLYTAVTGEAPFRGSTPEQTVLSVLSAKPVRPRKLKPQIPEGLELVIQCAMAKEPRDRYRDVGDVALSLSNLAGRPSPTTLARLEEEARRARSLPMRLQLLGVCSLGVVWVAGAVATAAASALELSGATLSLTPVTVALSSFAVAGGVVIAGRVLSHLRREVWPNTDRVLAWLRATRSGLAAAVMAYGVAALAVRLVEEQRCTLT
jgi:serine/threonine-protein kinase